MALGSLDDLSNYFHYFKASSEKARSNPIGKPWRAGRLKYLRAHGGRFRDDEMVRCCYQGLSMGDHHAPYLAQEAHCNVLRAAGCLRDDETLEYRKPLPRVPAGYFEGLMQDDRLGVQLVDRAQWELGRTPGRQGG